MKSPQDTFRQLPSIQRILAAIPVEPDLPRWAILDAARAELDLLRQALAQAPESTALPPLENLLDQIRSRAQVLARPRLDRVINATGVVVHTNLGRAPLSSRALKRLESVAAGYSNLEYDLEEGTRGSRHGIVDDTLCRLTGAEAAMVVNNNAAAVLLALSALASGREVIVSRGELVEIGGSFRIPDILLQSGCQLREVGTTNRTRLQDYARAVSSQTGALLKVHPSNYRVVGFTESASTVDLARLAAEKQLPLIEDLGSGNLLELGAWGLGEEPTAGARIKEGVDVLTMSGDKLLGGPQAGILLGRKVHIDACKRHPLARALRIDKLCLAALEGTLESYLAGDALREVPVVEMLTRSPARLKAGAEALLEALLEAVPDLPMRLQQGHSRVGGGAYPAQELPTWLVALRPSRGVSRLEAALRENRPPVIVRRQEGAVLLDSRTLVTEETPWIVQAVASWWKRERAAE